MSKNTIYSLVTILVLALIGAGVYFYQHKKLPVTSGTTTPTNATTTEGVKVTLDGGVPAGATATIEDRLNSQLFDKTPKPSLARTFPKGIYNDEQYAILKKQREDVVSGITGNPARMSLWISLGVLHKQVGDYEGARIYWSYVTTVNPNNLVAHWNLASLFELSLNDRAKAQQEFAQVIALDKTYVSAYIESANTYVDAGDTTNALSVLGKGIAANAGSTDLLIARARLYHTLKNTSGAKADYQAAIAAATKAGNSALVSQLQEEMSAL